MAKKTPRKPATKTRRKKPAKRNNTLKWVTLIVITIALIFFATGNVIIDSNNQQHKTQFDDLTTVTTAPQTPEHLVSYTAMTVSFNPTLHIPNWVSWELTRQETEGTLPRKERFLCDDLVPGCPDHWDYSYSGYNRGHMAPAADMKWSEKAMEESFLLTNICPQAKSLNSGTWKKLEDKCRTWAQIDSAIVIVCGPIVTDPIKEFIGDSRVAVPQRFFKAIISPYANPPRGIGFIMPNAKVPGGMQAAAVTIDSIEAVTGHDLFYALPDDIEAAIESQCRFHTWSTLRPKQ